MPRVPLDPENRLPEPPSPYLLAGRAKKAVTVTEWLFANWKTHEHASIWMSKIVDGTITDEELIELGTAAGTKSVLHRGDTLDRIKVILEQNGQFNKPVVDKLFEDLL